MPRLLIAQGASYSDRGDYDTAIIYFDIATWINPFYPYKAYAYYNRGLAYHAQDKLDLALSDYNKTVDSDPSMSNAYVGRCIIYNIQKKHDLAIEDCTKGIDLNTSDITLAYFNRGFAYLSNKKYNLAISDFSQANEISETAKSNCMIGIAYAEMENFATAIAFFKKGIELDTSGELGWCKTALEKAALKLSTP